MAGGYSSTKEIALSEQKYFGRENMVETEDGQREDFLKKRQGEHHQPRR